MMRRVVLTIVLLLPFFTIVAERGNIRAASDISLSFLENNSYYMSYPEHSFRTNMVIYHVPKDFDRIANTAQVKLLPETDAVTIEEFEFTKTISRDSSARTALSLLIRSHEPGVYEFHSMGFQIGGVELEVPLGLLTIEVLDGSRGGMFNFFESAGIFSVGEPLQFTVREQLSEEVHIEAVLLHHPDIFFDESMMYVGDQRAPWPDGGVSLAPGESIRIRVEWQVNMDEYEKVNMEVIPILKVVRNGITHYVGLHNMVFRKE
mgnify:FL=1